MVSCKVMVIAEQRTVKDEQIDVKLYVWAVKMSGKIQRAMSSNIQS